MTEEEWIERDNAFDKELRELREKYPEFYIEVWGPWDFVVGKSRDHMPSHDEIIRKVIKHKNEWPNVVNELHEGFDANFGTNWDRIWNTLQELERYGSK